MRFTGICLITDNVPALTNFYKMILDVEAVGNEVHTELKIDGATISIFSTQGMENMAPFSMQGAVMEGLQLDLK